MSEAITDPAATGAQAPDAAVTAAKLDTTAPAERMLSQSEVNRIVAKERGQVERQLAEERAARAEVEKRVADIDRARQEAEDSKLSQAQRAEKERERERKALETERDAFRAQAESERAERQSMKRLTEASRRVAGIAPRLFDARLSEHVSRIVADALVVEVVDGKERLALRTDEGLESYDDAAWERFVAAKLAPFFKAEGGSGAPHGAGNNGRPMSPDALRAIPTGERIALGLRQRASR